MLIKEDALRHWMDHFYGYGSWTSKVWFVGYEESAGDLPEEVAERLDYFAALKTKGSETTLCDIRELHSAVRFRADGPRGHLFNTLYDYRFGSHAVLHGLWKNLIAFRHGFLNEDLPDLLACQQTSFVSPVENKEMLIHLFPLPAHHHAWYYGWLDFPDLPFLKTRAQYHGYFFSRRIGYILERIRKHVPEIVLMYGMENVNALKEVVQNNFPGVRFSLAKGTKQHMPQHHRADLEGTTLLITTQVPALKHRRVETGFDWHAFGKSIRGKT